MRKIFLATFVATALLLTGATRYVTQSGAGAHDGTSVANAWSVANFNALATTALSGGDIVHMQGAISTTLTMPSSGTAGNPITMEGDSGSTFKLFSFGGLNNITLHNATMLPNYTFTAANNAATDTVVDMTGASNCIVDALTSDGKRPIPLSIYGNPVFTVASTTDCKVINSTITNFDGEGFQGGGSLRLSILNNTIKTAGGTYTGGYYSSDQNDCISIGSPDTLLVQGNIMVTQKHNVNLTTYVNDPAEKGGHNDLIQVFAPGGVQPKDVTIANNWLEIGNVEEVFADGTHNPTPNTGNWNFFMQQYNIGYLNIYGNIIYSHDWNTAKPIMAGSCPQYPSAGVAAAAATQTRIYNNTFISLNNGSDTFLGSSDPHPNAAAGTQTFDVTNNIFYSDNNGGSAPIGEGFGNNFTMSHNTITGWQNAYNDHVLGAWVALNGTWGAGGRSTLLSDLHFNSLVKGSEDFGMAATSIAKANATATPAVTPPLKLVTSGQNTGFPAPTLQSSNAIGAVVVTPRTVYTRTLTESTVQAIINGTQFGYSDATNGPQYTTPVIDGDIIQLPSGSATWTATLTNNNLDFSLMGAGESGTTITEAVTNRNNPVIGFTLTHDAASSFTYSCRISGIYWKSQAGLGIEPSDHGLIMVTGQSSYVANPTASNPTPYVLGCVSRVRLDHMTTDNLLGLHYWLDSITGVGDHLTTLVTTGGYQSYPVKVSHINWTPTLRPDNGQPMTSLASFALGSWADSTYWGTDKWWVFEDSSFTQPDGTNAADNEKGARVVYRHCTFKGGKGLATHGFEGSAGAGVRAQEIYNNYYDIPNAGGAPPLAQTRSGTMLWFNNEIRNAQITGTTGLPFHNYRLHQSYANWGAASGDNRYDSNAGGAALYSGTVDTTPAPGLNSVSDAAKNFSTSINVGDNTFYSINDISQPTSLFGGPASADPGWKYTHSQVAGVSADTHTLSLIAQSGSVGSNIWSPTWVAGNQYDIRKVNASLGQVGRGKMALMTLGNAGNGGYDTWTFPATSGTKATNPMGGFPLDPCYSWNNHNDSTNSTLPLDATDDPGLQANRDYFNKGEITPLVTQQVGYPAQTYARATASYPNIGPTSATPYTPLTYPHPLAYAVPPPFPRLALIHDGNLHDTDDICALPLALALLSAAGKADKLVLVEYNNHFWSNNSTWAGDMGVSSEYNTTRTWNGFTNLLTANVNDAHSSTNTYKATAQTALTNLINSATASDPVTIICAGPMQTIGMALAAATATARANITLISHSTWNDNHATDFGPGEGLTGTAYSWNTLSSGPTKIHIPDQNGNDNGSPTVTGGGAMNGQLDTGLPTGYNWLANTGDPKWQWLYDRGARSGLLRGGTRANVFAPSDAGMVYYYLTGDAATTPTKVKAMLGTPNPSGGSRWDHIFIVPLENLGYQKVVGNTAAAPYFNNVLKPKGVLYTHSLGLVHPSLPNYLIMLSGSQLQTLDAQGKGDDACVYTSTVPHQGPFNVPTLYSALGGEVAGYFESMATNGQTTCSSGSGNGLPCDFKPDVGLYAVKHNPFTYFSNSGSIYSVMSAANNIPTSAWKVYPPTDAPAPFDASVYTGWPKVSFIVPNIPHDMHVFDGGVTCPNASGTQIPITDDIQVNQGDDWMAANLPNILAYCQTHRGLLILTMDEGDDSTDPINQHIVTFVAGADVPAGQQVTTTVNHYNMVKTITNNFGVAGIGTSASSADYNIPSCGGSCGGGGSPPSFNSSPSDTWTQGVASSTLISVTSNPTATNIAKSGTWPSWLTLTYNGNNTATLSGTGNVVGTYAFNIAATNTTGTTIQTFSLGIVSNGQFAPSFISQDNTAFTAGTFKSFTVSVNANPIATLSKTAGTLPTGITFTPNADNTGTLSGTTTQTGTFTGISFQATNSVGTATQNNFTITVNGMATPTPPSFILTGQKPALPAPTPTPTPQFLTSNQIAFTQNQTSNYTVRTASNPPASIALTSGTLPSNISYVNNNNNTGTFSGIPNTAGVYGNILLTATNPGGQAQQTVTITVQGTATVKPAPQGIVALMSGKLDSTNTLASQSSMLDNPYCDGVRIKARWADVEPTAGNFDWSFIDAALNTAQGKTKWVGLDVNAGIDCPDWLYQAPYNVRPYVLQDTSGNNGLTIPYPGDATFITRYKLLIDALGQKYSSDQRVRYVVICGPGNHDEWNVASGPIDTANLGDTATINAWVAETKSFIDKYATAFPTTSLTAALAKPFGNTAGLQAETDTSDYGALTYPNRFTLTFNGLNPGANSAYLPVSIILKYWKTNRTGAQMGHQGNQSANACPPAEGLDQSLRAAANNKIRYVEVYKPDMLIPGLYDYVVPNYNTTTCTQPYIGTQGGLKSRQADFKAIPLPPVP